MVQISSCDHTSATVKKFKSRNWFHCTDDLMLFCLDSAGLLMMNEQRFYLFGQIKTSQTGGQPYSDTSPNGECSLVCPRNSAILNTVTPSLLGCTSTKVS